MSANDDAQAQVIADLDQRKEHFERTLYDHQVKAAADQKLKDAIQAANVTDAEQKLLRMATNKEIAELPPGQVVSLYTSAISILERVRAAAVTT